MRELLHDVAGWVRSKAGAIWRAMAPHAAPSVARGAVADAIRCRRELVLENAMLRQQIIVLRRKRPHLRLTRLDRLRLLVGAAVLPGWRRALAIVQPTPTGALSFGECGATTLRGEKIASLLKWQSSDTAWIRGPSRSTDPLA
jgi:hypothetical protein